jgi:hypothetical protein
MFSNRLILASLTASVFLIMLPTVTSQDPGKAAEQQKLVEEIQKAKDLRQQIVSDLLKSIEVNGKELPADSLQRETVFLAGNNLIELKILEFMVEEWKARLIKEEGKKEADFAVDIKVSRRRSKRTSMSSR